AVSQTNTANAIACMTRVKLMLMALRSVKLEYERLSGAGSDAEERIAEGEQHRNAQSDDERGVDQAEQQEHLRLQLRHELRLTRCALEEARAHNTHTDTRTGGAQPDHETDADAGVGLDHGQSLQ